MTAIFAGTSMLIYTVINNHIVSRWKVYIVTQLFVLHSLVAHIKRKNSAVPLNSICATFLIFLFVLYAFFKTHNAFGLVVNFYIYLILLTFLKNATITQIASFIVITISFTFHKMKTYIILSVVASAHNGGDNYNLFAK
ncbi:hypothetical protein ACJX0J_018866 [Zea mays]